MKPKRVLTLAALFVCTGVTSSCQLLREAERDTDAINENRNAIEKTTKSIQRNASAVNESTEKVGLNIKAVQTASEAILTNSQTSIASLKEVQRAAIESRDAILDNERAIKANTQAIIENEKVVRDSTATILHNGRALQRLDAIFNRFARHKPLIIISALTLIALVVAPYIALCFTLLRLHRMTKCLSVSASRGEMTDRA